MEYDVIVVGRRIHRRMRCDSGGAAWRQGVAV